MYPGSKPLSSSSSDSSFTPVSPTSFSSELERVLTPNPFATELAQVERELLEFQWERLLKDIATPVALEVLEKFVKKYIQEHPGIYIGQQTRRLKK